MGGQVSTAKVTSETVNHLVASAVIKNNAVCSASTTQSQGIKLGTVGGNFTLSGATFDAESKVNLSCLQESANNASLANEISNQIMQQAAAKNTGQNIGAQVSLTDEQSKLVNDISQSIDIQNVKSCLANSNQNQVISAENVQGNVTLTDIQFKAATDLVSNCIQKDANTSALVNKLANSLSQTATASNAGFLNFDSSNLIIIVVIIIALIIGMKQMKSSSSTSSS